MRPAGQNVDQPVCYFVGEVFVVETGFNELLPTYSPITVFIKFKECCLSHKLLCLKLWVLSLEESKDGGDESSDLHHADHPISVEIKHPEDPR